MKAINKQDLINYLKKSPDNLNFNIFGTMLDDFRNTYETDEQIVNKIKGIITNIIEDGGSISPEDDTITELVDLITELLPEKMIIKPVGTLPITENGEYDVMNKAGVNVEVPLPSGTIQITQNGNTNVNDYEYANVNVIDVLGDYIRSNITTFEIPEGTTSIPANIFKNYTNLETIIIPDSAISIGENTFNGCTNLVTVDGGCYVTNIGGNAFYGCPSTLVTGTKGQIKYSIYNNKMTISGNADIPVNAFKNNLNVYKVNIKNGVTGIGDYAFFSCKSLKSVTIPDSMTSIGRSAFYGCTGLTSIEIPNSVTSIGSDAFYNCTGLTSIVIPDSVTSIGDNAFTDCTGLTSIVIPDSVTSISDNTFNNTAWYNNQPDGLVYAGKFAYNYKGTMPSNTSIIIQDGTKGIANSAFYARKSLKSVTIPDSVTSIGKSVFSYCTGLTSITIPDSVTSIGDNAFYNCQHLTDIYYTGTEEEWNQITISSGNESLTNATIHYNYTPSN